MKKYRCPNCKATFSGTPDKCPQCGVTLRYTGKEQQPKQEQEATTISNFSFNDPEVVKHEDKVVPVTSVESFEDPEATTGPKPPVQTQFMPNGDSFFDGHAFQRVGIILLSLLIFLISAGIAYPWAMCMKMRWETKHTVIQGHRLKFTGKGIQLFGRYLLWLLLTIFTVGIILFWVQIFLKQWKAKHTEFAD